MFIKDIKYMRDFRVVLTIQHGFRNLNLLRGEVDSMLFFGTTLHSYDKIGTQSTFKINL